LAASDRDEDDNDPPLRHEPVEEVEDLGCGLTSSAVVGSPATMTRGSFASAIANEPR
jgi:hypothetical protein